MFDQIVEFSTSHPILVMSFFAIAGIILFTELRNLSAKYSNIGPALAIGVINKEDAVLIDVREMNEIKEGMINNAIHIPLSAINKRLTELDKYKDRAVLVYCRSGNRSGSVCRTLSSRGFEKVYNLAGGIMAWQDAHLPVSKKRKK